MPNLINIGVSGLKASQVALGTTMHNISNVATEGYSRQTVQHSARPAQFTGAGYQGQGVDVTDIIRIADDFINSTYFVATSDYNQAKTYFDLASRLDNLIADSGVSVPDGINQFFSAVGNAINEPNSIPARQVFLTRANILASRINNLDTQFKQETANLNATLVDTVDRINTLGKEIASLNTNIIESLGAAGHIPNDLYDQRDMLINELSSKVSLTLVNHKDGSVDVFIGKNQAFVLKGESYQLSTKVNPNDIAILDVVYSSNDGSSVITNSLSGGAIGGIYGMRNEVLLPAQNQLNLFAIGFADLMNEQHKKGIDLTGNLGENLFYDINNHAQTLSRAAKFSENKGTAVLSLHITDVNELTIDNYQLNFDGTYYNLINFSTHMIEQRTTSLANITGLGFSLELESGTMEAGDNYSIRPTLDGARLFNLEIRDPRDLALASPIRMETNVSNTGSGVIANLVISDTSGSPVPTSFVYGNAFKTPKALTPPIEIRFTSATTYQVYDVTTGPGVQIGPDQIYDPSVGATVFPISGITNATPPGPNPTYTWDPGYSFQITGEPLTGDVFSVGFNTNGITDNQNAVSMFDLRTLKTMFGSTASVTDTYANMVGSVGNRAKSASTAEIANESLLMQIKQRKESISGVNSEEEAGNLLKYQQAYEAASKIIQMAKELFDVLISTFSR